MPTRRTRAARPTASSANQNESLRLTWQIVAQEQAEHAAPEREPAAAVLRLLARPADQRARGDLLLEVGADAIQSQAGWNSPVTSRLLLEAGVLYNNKDYPTQPQPDNAPNQVAYSDSGTGFSWGNYGNTYGHNASHNFNTRFAASYVTGSHAIKAGFTFMHLWALTSSDVVNNGMTLQLLNGVPRQVTVFATPLRLRRDHESQLGLSSRRISGRIKRMTLNVGVRFDSLEDLRAGADASGRARRCRRATSRSTQSTTCRTGRTCRRGSASPTTCSATARRPSKCSIGRYLEGAEPRRRSPGRRIRPAASCRAPRARGPTPTATSCRSRPSSAR